MKGTINARSTVASAKQKPRRKAVGASKRPAQPSARRRPTPTGAGTKSSARTQSKSHVSANDLSALRESRRSLSARSVARPRKEASVSKKTDNAQLIRFVALTLAYLVITFIDIKVGVGFALGLIVCWSGHVR